MKTNTQLSILVIVLSAAFFSTILCDPPHGHGGPHGGPHDKVIPIGAFWINGTEVRRLNPNVTFVLFEAESELIHKGLVYWLEKVNANGIKIKNKNHRFSLKMFHIGHVQGTDLASMEAARSNIATILNANKDRVAWFAPFTSALHNVTAIETEKAKRILMSTVGSNSWLSKCDQYYMDLDQQTPCQEDGDRRFKYLFKTVASDSIFYNDVIQAFSSQHHVNTSVFWHTSDIFSSSIISSAREYSENLGITTSLSFSVPYSTDIDDAKMDALALTLKNLSPQPDVIIGGHVSSAICQGLPAALKRNNYVPKGYVLNCPNVNYIPDGGYLTSYAPFSCSFTGNNFKDIYHANTNAYCTGFRTRFGFDSSYTNDFDSQTYASAYTLQNAIERAQSLNDKKIREKLKTTNLVTVRGRYQFNPYQEIHSPGVVVYQFNPTPGSSKTIISPSNIATGSLVYPIPPSGVKRAVVEEMVAEKAELKSGAFAVVNSLLVVLLYVLI